MSTVRSVPYLIGVVAVVTVVIGLFSFYLAQGMAGLASDVGVSGAWFVATLFQLIYAACSAIGFALFAFLGRKKSYLKPSLLSALSGAAIVTISINIFGIYNNTGSEFTLVQFILCAIPLSLFVYMVTSSVVNGLTLRSNGTAQKRAAP